MLEVAISSIFYLRASKNSNDHCSHVFLFSKFQYLEMERVLRLLTNRGKARLHEMI